MHPSVVHVLQYFKYDHLQGKLREVSQQFHDLAFSLVSKLRTDNPEVTVALRKLLEAKDAAVRAALTAD